MAINWQSNQTKQKVLQVACFMLAIFACLPVPIVIPAFKDLFQSFGAELHWLTGLLLNHAYAFHFIAAVMLGLLFISLLSRSARLTRRLNGIALSSLLFAVVLVLVSIFALQLPVISMSDAS